MDLTATSTGSATRSGNARSACGEVPPDRWNIDEFYDPTGEVAGKMSVRWAALIDGPGEFDPDEARRFAAAVTAAQREAK